MRRIDAGSSREKARRVVLETTDDSVILALYKGGGFALNTRKEVLDADYFEVISL